MPNIGPISERRGFLQLLLATALTSGAMVESVVGQQPAVPSQPARGPGLQRQPLPAPFTGLDAAFAEVTIQPGAPSRPHRHSGFVLGYVIEGDFLFGTNGAAPRVVHAGEIFYEAPGATHSTSASANPDRPVRLLAIVIGPQGAVITTPAG
jgi:quercetin dioxygenase-like cupin family protein